MNQPKNSMFNTSYSNKSNIKKNMLIPIVFSAVFLSGIIICLICDIAISGSCTWSLITTLSIAFAWAVFFPVAVSGKNGIIAGLLSFSVFIVPYLFILSNLLKVEEVFSIGTASSVISIIFLWISAAIFKYIGRTNKFTATGIVFLLAIPFIFIVNITLSKIIKEPVFGIWDMLSVLKLLVFAFICFIFAKRR